MAAVSSPTPIGASIGTGRWRNLTGPLDLSIAAVLAAWALLEATVPPGPDIVERSVFAVAVTAPLVLRRRYPIGVTVAICGVFVAYAAMAGPQATVAPFPSLLVASFTVAERVRLWWLAALVGVLPLGAMLTATALDYFGDPGVETTGVVLLVFFIGATWAAGRVIRHRVLVAQAARETSAQEAADAVRAERDRIARELHDIVAHALTIVTLQSSAARAFLEKDPGRAAHHLDLTRRTAQRALGEMRDLLGVLSESPAPYAPQPGVPQLAALVAESREAGHDCVLEVTSEIDLTDGQSLAVYRVVQEALTNVHKHAPGAAASVIVRRDGASLEATVENCGSASEPVASAPGGGRGIPGMTERLRVYGGTLEAGPVGRSGWRVRARLPVDNTS